MGFLKRVLMTGVVLFFLTGEVCAAEVILKITCLESDALKAFRSNGVEFSADRLVIDGIDYHAVASALTSSVINSTEAVQKTSIQNTHLVSPVLRDIPVSLQSLYPEQGRIIGRQSPGGSSGWHKYLIDFNSNAQVAFIELGVERAVLDSLATGSAVSGLQNRPIQQYTHGGKLDPNAVFTAGYSFFVQQLARGNAHEWLQNIMPLQNGIGIVALRRAGSETRTDTIILGIDPRYLPRNMSGQAEAMVVLGWDRLY